MRGSNRNRRELGLSSASSNSYHPNRSHSFQRTPIKNPKLTRSKQCSNLPPLQSRPSERRLAQKMRRVDRLQGSYKRANNNCHRKYISALKNQLKQYFTIQTQNELAQRYSSLSNSRVYFFVLLTYAKWLLRADQIRSIYAGFSAEIHHKIANYTLEMRNSRNDNFCNFRRDEIVELKSARESARHFLKDYSQEAIKILFLKDKDTIVKKEDFFKALLFIKELERGFIEKMSVRALAIKISGMKLEEESIEKDNLKDSFVLNQEKSISSGLEYASNQVQIIKQAVKIQGAQFQNTLLPKDGGVQQPDPAKQEQHITASHPLFLLQNSIGNSDYFLLNRIVLQKQKKMQFRIERQRMVPPGDWRKVLGRTVEATGLTEVVKIE